tara:strand:+ start:4344 stop:4556 length:213 start_codon:yes stop_codon:yes gene_type:complete
MKKAYVLILILSALSFPSHAQYNEYSLFIKTCKTCDWITYPTPFRLKEQCEIARQGIFLRGMTKCLKTYN